ncbi:hypothetical protein MOC48_07425, partial [Bacillus haynesii]|nr:hypothetical protein [Bacillus haynesii]
RLTKEQREKLKEQKYLLRKQKAKQKHRGNRVSLEQSEAQ